MDVSHSISREGTAVFYLNSLAGDSSDHPFLGEFFKKRAVIPYQTLQTYRQILSIYNDTAIDFRLRVIAGLGYEDLNWAESSHPAQLRQCLDACLNILSGPAFSDAWNMLETSLGQLSCATDRLESSIADAAFFLGVPVEDMHSYLIMTPPGSHHSAGRAPVPGPRQGFVLLPRYPGEEQHLGANMATELHEAVHVLQYQLIEHLTESEYDPRIFLEAVDATLAPAGHLALAHGFVDQQTHKSNLVAWRESPRKDYRLAALLAPLTKEYLDAKRSMDQEYMNQMLYLHSRL